MNNDGLICMAVTWAVAALAGIFAAAMLMVLGGWTFMQGAFVGVLVFLVGGAFLAVTMCRPLPRPGTVHPAQRALTPAAPAHTVAEAVGVPAGTSTAAAAPAPVAAAAGAAPAAPAAAVEAPAPVAPPPAAPAAAAPAATPAKAAAKPAKAAAKPAAKAAKPAAKAAAQRAEAAAPAAPARPAPAAAPSGPSRPRALKAARKGGPDDLKMIKGVGPKLETMLHGMGIFHFDQIAAWTDSELAWVDENLEGFKGRASRDNWIPQAQTLAAGGQTEFSKRVGEGEVY
jgi:predicted flap endonuclease-1-like 5' DNA nuclease